MKVQTEKKRKTHEKQKEPKKDQKKTVKKKEAEAYRTYSERIPMVMG